MGASCADAKIRLAKGDIISHEAALRHGAVLQCMVATAVETQDIASALGTAKLSMPTVEAYHHSPLRHCFHCCRAPSFFDNDEICQPYPAKSPQAGSGVAQPSRKRFVAFLFDGFAATKKSTRNLGVASMGTKDTAFHWRDARCCISALQPCAGSVQYGQVESGMLWR